VLVAALAGCGNGGGMSDLIQGANSAGYEWVVTGAVLLLAAGFDAIVRRARAG
jgi:D-xylose transport system permease protein